MFVISIFFRFINLVACHALTYFVDLKLQSASDDDFDDEYIDSEDFDSDESESTDDENDRGEADEASVSVLGPAYTLGGFRIIPTTVSRGALPSVAPTVPDEQPKAPEPRFPLIARLTGRLEPFRDLIETVSFQQVYQLSTLDQKYF